MGVGGSISLDDDRPAALSRSPSPTLLLSRHDYRSAARANIHFLADEFSRRGPTRFASVGFSTISKIRGDPRVDLPQNRVERRGRVDCLLWSTFLHPVALPRPARPIERASFELYGRLVSRHLLDWINSSHTIVIESGIAVSLARTVRTRNSGAKLIYNASDDLRTVGAAATLVDILARDIGVFDRVRIPSALLGPMLPPTPNAVIIPQGLDPALLQDQSPSPYGPGKHGVSVGSMLFDPAFFEVACRLFPDITFHVIGAGPPANKLSAPNLRVYPTLPHAQTIPFIKNADFGIAAYRLADQPAYLADSSMKLIQFAAFGLLSVCPGFAAGGRPERIAYDPGDLRSLRSAITTALGRGRIAPRLVPSWSDVVDQMISD